jgi:hypothetical protein
MGYRVTGFILFLSLLSMGFQCEKESGETREENRKAVITKDNTLEVNLGSYGTEEGASLYNPAVHAAVCSTERRGNDMFFIYHPLAGYTGYDEAVIRSSRGCYGDLSGCVNTFLTFQITINP